MFKYLLIFIWIKTIYCISGCDEEIFEPNGGVSHKVNLEDFCPCDKTAQVCDLKCCCDEDCLYYMLDKDYYNKYSECDSLSSVNNRIDSRLDYCEGHKKSIDDLYNPLVLAFKILKKGFCLAKKNPKSKNNDKNEIYKGLIDEIEKDQSIGSQKIDFNEVLPSNTPKEFSQFQNIDDFKKMAFNAPISLPNGLCLFNSYPIKKFMDYEVECSYYKDQHEAIINYFSDVNISPFLIKNSFYSNTSNAAEGNYIKKVEIIYFQVDGNYKINHYYEDINPNDVYIDFTFVVTFLKNESDYIRNGNPGYIKGKPLLIGEEDNKNFKKYKNDIVFPIDYPDIDKTQINIGFFYYYNNYFDNKLTFEDLIIYGYDIINYNKELSNELFRLLNNNNMKIGIFGNASVNYQNDWETIKSENSQASGQNPYLLFGLYKDTGAVNNTQFQIVEFKRIFRNNLDVGDNYFYFITKFLKLKTQKDWWYAKGPGFIKLPKNIMYPFRIGTTDYESKKR